MAQQKITFNEVSTNTAIVTSQLDSASSNGTGAILVPSGTTAQRPAATTSGYIRFNTTLGSLESANGSAWANVGSGSAGSGGVSWQSVQNTNFIAVSGNGYAVNTQIANVTVTLPASPTVGSFITLVDYKSTFGSNNLILYPNGNKIGGNTANVRISGNGQGISLVYIDATQGWINYSTASPVGTYLIDYLVVAGGGGGGNDVGGGGGAGGLIGTFNASITTGTTLSVTVGGGGAGSTVNNNSSAPGGGNSIFNGTTALGGGGGGNYPFGAGGSGGSGGGGGTTNGTGSAGGSGTQGQGNPGGNGSGSGGSGNYGIGGGGGGAGNSGSGANGGAGTSAYSTWASATSTGSPTGYYAGGGAGADDAGTTNGTAGVGGGGQPSGGPAGPGSTNTGGGGGGSGAGNGAPGGSGIVIIRYQNTFQRATGGTVTFSGGYYYHTFTSSGNFLA